MNREIIKLVNTILDAEKAERADQDQLFQERMKDYKGFVPKPNSLWLVLYECRYDVIRVSADGQGFFAPGQEPLWFFDCVQEWVKEIEPPTPL